MSPAAAPSEGAAHRLLAHVLHIRTTSCPARVSMRVEGAQRHHVAQAGQQRLIAQRPAHGPTASPSRLSTRMME
jgi:hypothetical protein